MVLTQKGINFDSYELERLKEYHPDAKLGPLVRRLLKEYLDGECV